MNHITRHILSGPVSLNIASGYYFGGKKVSYCGLTDPDSCFWADTVFNMETRGEKTCENCRRVYDSEFKSVTAMGAGVTLLTLGNAAVAPTWLKLTQGANMEKTEPASGTYFITGVRPSGKCKESRCFGHYGSLHEAWEAVEENRLDLNEAGYYPNVVIVYKPFGIHTDDEEIQWFEFDEDRYRKCDRPEHVEDKCYWLPVG